MWPAFSLWCGIFTLHDYKHAEKEVEKIHMINLTSIPNRQYDPRKVAYNVTFQAKITRFGHEVDDFDDLFALAKIFYRVKGLATIKYGEEELEKFSRLRAQRLQTLPLDLLATTVIVQPQSQSK